MNPQYCYIARVENGWVLTEGAHQHYEGRKFVFTTPAALAKFISENFCIPKPETKKEQD